MTELVTTYDSLILEFYNPTVLTNTNSVLGGYKGNLIVAYMRNWIQTLRIFKSFNVTDQKLVYNSRSSGV